MSFFDIIDPLNRANQNISLFYQIEIRMIHGVCGIANDLATDLGFSTHLPDT